MKIVAAIDLRNSFIGTPQGVLFFCLFAYEFCKSVCESEYYDYRQNDAANAVERVEVVDDVVKAEEAQRIRDNEAQKDDNVSVRSVGKFVESFGLFKAGAYSVADDF